MLPIYVRVTYGRHYIYDLDTARTLTSLLQTIDILCNS